MEHRKRSVAKAASYRVVATTMVFLIAFGFTGETVSAAKIGGAAAVGKTALYYAWERLWSRISWGMKGEMMQ